ncbi:MAG: hypothetical protein JWM90_1930 [Thermoleophilia bacterium]|nr:hypothetical protein [Thermoleophilia bacterium]
MVLALALVAAGCGGGEEIPVDAAAPVTDPAAVPVDPNAAPVDPNAAPVEPNAPVDPNAVPGTPVAGGATDGSAATNAGSDVPGLNEIANADASSGTPIKLSALTPKVFKSAHCRKPIIVVLYQPGAILDAKLLAEARAAKASVKGSTQITYTPKDVKAFGDLPAKLGLLSAPGVAIVNRDGTFGIVWTSYVDRELIAKALRYAASTKQCKLSVDDVPAAGEPVASDLSNAAALVSGAKPAASTTLAGTTTPAAGTVAATPGAAAPIVTGAPAS